jgi:uncharacterized protein (TIGR02145 family)
MKNTEILMIKPRGILIYAGIFLFCLGFISCKTNTVKDIDDNVYPTVKIGNQVWMAENLKTTRYCNGDLIGTTTPATLDIELEIAPKYQWAYDGDENNVQVFGRLYTWYVATDSRNVCPTGWHVPTDSEWTDLTDYLINNGYAFGTGYQGMDIAKSLAATSGWVPDETPGSAGNDQKSNNITGFGALPGGGRVEGGKFIDLGHVGDWWSVTERGESFMQVLSCEIVNLPGGVFRDIYHDYCYVNSYSNNKKYGLSIRCLKNK